MSQRVKIIVEYKTIKYLNDFLFRCNLLVYIILKNIL